VTTARFTLVRWQAAGTALIHGHGSFARNCSGAHPAKHAAVLKVGTTRRSPFPGLKGAGEGKVILVSPALDPNSTTVEVWVQAKNPKQTLEARIECPFVHGVRGCTRCISGTASALLTGSDGRYHRHGDWGTNQHAHQQAIKVGIRQADKVQITEGLKEGQRVRYRGSLRFAGQSESFR